MQGQGLNHLMTPVPDHFLVPSIFNEVIKIPPEHAGSYYLKIENQKEIFYLDSEGKICHESCEPHFFYMRSYHQNQSDIVSPKELETAIYKWGILSLQTKFFQHRDQKLIDMLDAICDTSMAETNTFRDVCLGYEFSTPLTNTLPMLKTVGRWGWSSASGEEKSMDTIILSSNNYRRLIPELFESSYDFGIKTVLSDLIGDDRVFLINPNNFGKFITDEVNISHVPCLNLDSEVRIAQNYGMFVTNPDGVRRVRFPSEEEKYFSSFVFEILGGKNGE